MKVHVVLNKDVNIPYKVFLYTKQKHFAFEETVDGARMMPHQSWTRIGFIHGLNWIGLDWVDLWEKWHGLDRIGSDDR